MFSTTALTSSPKWNDLNLSHGSVVQKSCGLDWFVCLKSQNTSIKVLSGMFFSGSLGEQVISRLIQVAGELHFHVPVGLRPVSSLAVSQGLFSPSRGYPHSPLYGPHQIQRSHSSHYTAWNSSDSSALSLRYIS